MLRLTPYFHREQIILSDALRMSFAGAESNTSIALANWGHDVTMITAFPENTLGDTALAYLNTWNIDTDHIIRNTHRMGTYFIEHGVSLRPTNVVYDRKGSAFSQTHPDLYDWAYLFKGKKIFYLTGITPALSEYTEQSCRDALREAKRQGLTVFFDPNYRHSLWSKEYASNVIKDFFPYIDVLIANVGSAMDVLKYQPASLPTVHWDALREETQRAANYLHDYTGITTIALSMRMRESVHKHHLGGVLSVKGSMTSSQAHEVEVVDRLGGGDAFAAGIIHGWVQQWSHPTLISFAASSAAIQQTLPGDLNIQSVEDILHLTAGDRLGDVRR